MGVDAGLLLSLNRLDGRFVGLNQPLNSGLQQLGAVVYSLATLQVNGLGVLAGSLNLALKQAQTVNVAAGRLVVPVVPVVELLGSGGFLGNGNVAGNGLPPGDRGGLTGWNDGNVWGGDGGVGFLRDSLSGDNQGKFGGGGFGLGAGLGCGFGGGHRWWFSFPPVLYTLGTATAYNLLRLPPTETTNHEPPVDTRGY